MSEHNQSDQSARVITVDGPSGSGKGTISARLAVRLGYHFLDSGALYRLVALAALQDDLVEADGQRWSELAGDLEVAFPLDNKGDYQVLLRGEAVGARLRTEAVSQMASRVAAEPAVRAALVARQQAFQQSPGLVADGRDMGTVIFPRADLKIFLTASAEVRAERRYKQLKEKGENVTLGSLFREIEARDRRDAERELAPLKPAEDAIRVDSSYLDIEEVTEIVAHLAFSHGMEPARPNH